MNLNSNNLLWLVVDDDQDDQEIFTISTNKVDPSIECVFANNGVHAMEMLSDASFTPSCIFMDVNMPRMNGVECLEELVKIDRLKDVPVFMCSTSSDPKIIAKTKQLGAKDFIVKPSTIAEFKAILTEVKDKLEN